MHLTHSHSRLDLKFFDRAIRMVRKRLADSLVLGTRFVFHHVHCVYLAHCKRYLPKPASHALNGWLSSHLITSPLPRHRPLFAHPPLPHSTLHTRLTIPNDPSPLPPPFFQAQETHREGLAHRPEVYMYVLLARSRRGKVGVWSPCSAIRGEEV